MKKFLALMMALVMMVSCASLLSACGSKGDDLNGNWTATLDFTDECKAYFQDQIAGEMGDMGDIIDPDQLFDLSKLNAVMTWNMELKSDGSITMTVDGQQLVDSMGDVMNSMKDNLIAAIPQIMEASFAQDGMTMEDVEQALALMGMSMEEMQEQMAAELEESFETEVAAELAGLDVSATESGYYVVEGNKLYLLDNKGDKPSENSWMEFELQGDKLVVTDMAADLKASLEDLDDMNINLFPLTFVKG